MTTTTDRPAPSDPADRGSSAFTARVALGKVFAPVPSEFLLIASTALILTIFGLVMVLSATMATSGEGGPFQTVMRQAMFAILGVPLMFVFSRLPVLFWKRISWIALGLAQACPST